MAFKARFKTEHNGAKNGGGARDTRWYAKRISRKLRRSVDKRAAKIED